MNAPRVSIIIPIYNGDKYLQEAVNSVFQQTFQDWELLLVDDGSTDGSVALAQSLALSEPDKIRYLEHPGHSNHGQFATRVFGAKHARADLVALLDQDDVWKPTYLEAHLTRWDAVQDQGVYLSYGPSFYWHPGDATGAKDFVQPMPPGTPKVFAPAELLESYFAAGYANTPNPCCALIRREVFDHVGHLAPSAKGSPFEDQYLWWYVAARWPVAIHSNAWVQYRKHDDNCYERFTASPERAARTELEFLKTVRRDLVGVCPDHPLLSNGKLAERIRDLGAQVSLRRRWFRAVKRVLRIPADLIRPLERIIPTRMKRFGESLVRPLKVVPTRARMGVGIPPRSYLWGGDRGMPIFAHYINEFLGEFADDIRGHVLEFYNDQYKAENWEPRADRLDTLHFKTSSPQATLAKELSRLGDTPSDHFDCIVCTHTLQSIIEVEKAVRELYRVLKPGGTLLVAVPFLSMYDPGLEECWRFTDKGLEHLLAKVFGAVNVGVRSYGNSLTAAGQLRGLTVGEFTRAELTTHTNRFAVEVCCRAVKAG